MDMFWESGLERIRGRGVGSHQVGVGDGWVSANVCTHMHRIPHEITVLMDQCLNVQCLNSSCLRQ